MNPRAVARVIAHTTPPPVKRRAAYGQWAEGAAAVAVLVAEGWPVTAAVRKVVTALNLHPPDVAFKGVRARYYATERIPTTPYPHPFDPTKISL